MAFNPFRRTATKRPIITRKFTDSETGDSFSLSFRQLRGGEGQTANAAAEALIELYLIGSDSMPSVDFPRIPLPSGEPQPTITENQLHQAASFVAMQPPEANERYSAEEFVCMSYVLPNEVWLDVCRFAQEVDKATAPKNAERQAMNGNSEPAFATTTDTTNSTSDKMRSGARSTAPSVSSALN